jgi:hypothetical protein
VIVRKKGSLRTIQQLVSQRGKPGLDEMKALRRWLVERRRTNEPTSYVFASQKGGSLGSLGVSGYREMRTVE